MSNPYAYGSATPGPALSSPGSRADEMHAKLMTPAIVLLVFSAVSIVISLPWAGIMAFSVAITELPPDVPADGPERTGYLIGFYGSLTTMVAGPALSVPASAFTIWACVCMIRRRSWNIARAGAVVSLVPCLTACCILGIPFGAWCLVLLNDPDLQASFDRPGGNSPGPPTGSPGRPVAYGQPGGQPFGQAPSVPPSTGGYQTPSHFGDYGNR